MSNQLSRVETQKKRLKEEKSKPLLQRVTGKVVGQVGMKIAIPSVDAEQRDEQDPVPARTDTYSSQRIKLSKIFLNTLIVLFFLLTMGLVWWGVEGAPPLNEIWGL
ncbi:hypothetical protein [Paenibacillus sp. IHBB 10380]|uniref:hypothetical protein n=1 Tax=Paenibacillus sp. IHBB 10380 TaxID=1566358 RepID=UPI0005CFA9AD|nr:hypothetical protein [Paenibacillus sp. IHBB 10380]AJS58007.1 hypothetical protein UB51_05295 [Paenibacillus sp. IHBB 10380]